jgi:hypothetical protein
LLKKRGGNCTVIFAPLLALKFLLTIFFVFVFGNTFAQTDSFLQSLIDSAKVSARPLKTAKDTQKQITKIPVIKKDSVKRDSSKKYTPAIRDSFTVAKRRTDSVRAPSSDTSKNDTTAVAANIFPQVITKKLTWQEDTAFVHLLEMPVSKSKVHFITHEGDVHISFPKDYLFYVLAGVVLLFAIIKQLFPKYFQSMFRLMFQASFRQKQTREQMMQEIFPSLLMNILFVLVGGLFIALIAQIYQWLNISFWLLTLYCITLLSLIYIFKYLVIQFMGWVFNAREQASTYGFIVFLVNKVIALALLPLLLLLAFSSGYIQQVTLTVAGCAVIILLIFRYIVSLTIIRSTLSVHPLHFFIYLCAVELMPMLILYKVLFSYIGKSN